MPRPQLEDMKKKKQSVGFKWHDDDNAKNIAYGLLSLGNFYNTRSYDRHLLKRNIIVIGLDIKKMVLFRI